MSRLKYVYTPRRGAARNRERARPRIAIPPLLLAPLLIVVLLGAWWIARDSGSGESRKEPGVLAASCAPDKPCSATTTPGAGTGTPRPRTQVAPAGGADPPPITGISAIVLDEPCGGALFEQNPHLRVPPASLTKIMTALVATDHSDLSEMVPIDVNGPEISLETDSTVMGIEPGMTLSMRDLLYGLLLASGYDAAIQIAEHVAGTVPAFVRLMNEKAAAMGLTDTHFTNPHGLDDPALYTSAHDIAELGRELLQNPALAEIVRTRTYQPAWDKPPIENLNLLLGFYEGALGVKTGYTDLAGQTIVAAAERDGRRIIVSVLGAKTEIYADASELLEWAFTETDSACAPTLPTP